MKNIFAFILCLAALASCSTKAEQEQSAEWKELDSFHALMAKVYHPLKDSGDLKPAKEEMTRLADAAADWSAASLPEKVNTPAMREKLEKLKTESRALAHEISASASDDVIKAKVVKLHDLFHSIMEEWNNRKENDEEHDSH